MSMKKDRRRVSFAPDPELTMVHTFEKVIIQRIRINLHKNKTWIVIKQNIPTYLLLQDDDQSAGRPSPAVFEKIDESRQVLAPTSTTLPSDTFPGPLPLSSPQEADMEITMELTGNQPSHGDITASLPSLAAIAEADELYHESNNDLAPGNITASIPGLAALLEEDEKAYQPTDNIFLPKHRRSSSQGPAGFLADPSGAVSSPPVSFVPALSVSAHATAPSPVQSPSININLPDNTSNDNNTMTMDIAGTTTSHGLAAEGRHEGQASKWGFVPGDDDTMDMDLRGHGRSFMGDTTYSRMYADATATTLRSGAAHARPADSTGDSLAVVAEETADEEEQGHVAATEAVASQQQDQKEERPDWTAPAFLPPYTHGGDHPALHQSPDVTTSSINTLSTRRISVDTRRHSVTSRGAIAGGVTTTGAAVQAATAASPLRSLSYAGDGVLHGSVYSATKPQGTAVSDLKMSNGHSDRREDGGDAGSDMTDDLLADDDDVKYTNGAIGNNTSDVLAGLKQQMRMLSQSPMVLDPGASSAVKTIPTQPPIAAQQPMSPPHSGIHKMSHSPPMSALSAGASSFHGRRMSPVLGQHSMRTQSILGVTPATQQQRWPMAAAAAHQTPKSGMALVPLHPTAPTSVTCTGPGANSAPPGSAIAARYPGSAVATGRLSQGFTPSNLPPITFQDFAKVVEVQFLDNLRRGASINYADLQPNPVPSSLSEAYSLLCITSPHVSELETAIHTLQSETARLRASAADLELMLGQANPPIFRHVQTASYEQLEALRSNIALLKKMCRSKALVLLKDVRCQMEESKANRLARAMEGLKIDLAFVTEQRTHARGISEAAEGFARETKDRLTRQAEERAEEVLRRRRILAARAALAEQRSANEERLCRLEAATVRVNTLQEERRVLSENRSSARGKVEVLRSTLDALKAARNSRSTAGSLQPSLLQSSTAKDPKSVLDRLNAMITLERCLGVKVEQTGTDSMGGRCISLKIAGSLFRLKISTSAAGVRGAIELIQSSSSIGGMESARKKTRTESGAVPRSLAAAVAGCAVNNGAAAEAFFVDPEGVAAAVQATVARLQRSTDLALELDGVRAACNYLCEVSAARFDDDSAALNVDSASNGVRLLFVGMHAEVRFAVTLCPGPAYPLGALPHRAKIWFDGQGQVTASDICAAIARAPAGPNRIRAACAELSALVERAAPRAREMHDAFRTNFGNPLFGGSRASNGSGTQQAGTLVEAA